MPRASRKTRRALAVGVVAAEAAGAIAARARGYRLGRNAIVRCRQGHLFTTIWIPGASIKSLRLGWWRFQRCPVGPHWTLVAPVRESDLTEQERREARAHRDVRLP
jgi:hypothetical protein